MPDRVETIDTPIALEARDLIPETWNALAKAPAFGPAALDRRHSRILKSIFGEVIDKETQNALELLDGRLIAYAGKVLAYALLDPGIEYWSRQVQSFSVSERESKAYLNRAEDLRQMKKDWLPEIAALKLELGDLLVVRGPERDRPRVQNVGDGFPHLTPDPFALPPAYVAPEELI